jgi:hypothetical protein
VKEDTMKFHVAGTYNGVGSAIYIGFGFVPDWVKIWAIDNAASYYIEWNFNMLRSPAALCPGGLVRTAATGDVTELTTAGVEQYDGGDIMSAASTTYLVADDKDYRTSTTYGTISKWTLGSSTNKTGNWDVEADTNYVGAGSKITIREDVTQKVFNVAVNALTSNGEQANEVTLTKAVKSGTILRLSRLYDFVGAAKGAIIPAGIYLADVTYCNISGEMCAFEAGTYF